MIITLTGSNSFASKQALSVLMKQFVAEHGEHSIETVDGESCAPNRLPDLLAGATLFAPRRMVVVRGASSNKPLWDALGDWLPRVSDETTLVVVELAPDKRTKTFKALKKLSDFSEYAELEGPDLTAWIQKTATEQGGVLDFKTAQYLVQRAGTRQEQLWQELQKLISYQPQVTQSTIDILVEPTTSANVFELLDAAIGGNPQRVQVLITKLQPSEDPYKLFGLMVSQVFTAAIVSSAGSKSADAISKEATLHPYVVRKTQAQAIGQARLHQLIDAVADLDTQLKTGSANPWLLLGQCLNKIATL
jgi:DNA polymerase III delta subunit